MIIYCWCDVCLMMCVWWLVAPRYILQVTPKNCRFHPWITTVFRCSFFQIEYSFNCHGIFLTNNTQIPQISEQIIPMISPPQKMSHWHLPSRSFSFFCWGGGRALQQFVWVLLHHENFKHLFQMNPSATAEHGNNLKKKLTSFPTSYAKQRANQGIRS